MQKRVYRIKAPAGSGGAPCEVDGFETQFQKCNVGACTADCVGDWGPWGKCDVPCGGGGSCEGLLARVNGVRVRRFSVFKAARAGGAGCEAASGDTAQQDCTADPCE